MLKGGGGVGVDGHFPSLRLQKGTPSDQAAVTQARMVRVRATGLKWVRIGGGAPAEGREISNARLAFELTSKDAFTQEEWDSFGIETLRVRCLSSSTPS